MGMTFWVAICVIVVVSVIADSIVKIVKASTSGGGKGMQERMANMEEDIAITEQELDDARKRIEVLEKIVTDDKSQLSKQIDDLANG